jgi:hypothetical protein
MHNHWLRQHCVTNGQANRVRAWKHTWATSTTAKATAAAATLTSTKGSTGSRALTRSGIASTLAAATTGLPTTLSISALAATLALRKQCVRWVHQREATRIRKVVE